MQVAPINIDEPIASPLERFAHLLAEQHLIARSPAENELLLQAMQRWSESLIEAYQFFRTSASKEPAVIRAGEWMLDNFYLVEQILRQIKEDLPTSYYKQLPKLSNTSLRHYPRVFALASELVAHNQCRLDLSQLTAFVSYYQHVSLLTTGELWALPIMLRMALLEQMSAAVASIARLNVPAKLNTDPLLPVSPDITLEAVVANCFFSLRLLDIHDWKTFFEETSRVEQRLGDDPAGIYKQMDFDTRNTYRSVIEELARHSDHDEESVARLAVGFARDAAGGVRQPSWNGHNASVSFDRITHVGFYLIDEGRAQLEASLGYRPSRSVRLQRWILAHPTLTYFGSISLITLLVLIGLLVILYLAGGSLMQLVVVGLLGLLLATAVAITLVHRIITRIIPPRTLPRMDFSHEIPDEYRTVIVIPTLMTSLKEVDSLLHQLEIHFLRNPDPNLGFALLSDFADASAEETPEDAAILERATSGIEALNRKYAPRAPFYIFHRKRIWNPSEGVWMGWERKRGKLHEFNRVIMGAESTSYTWQVGDLNALRETRYVITLDADTVLPQGNANRLIATLAHPLNRAEFAPDGRSVIAGYTVLQPRVGIKPTSANRSLFTRLFAGDTGIDLYTLAVSDVYQDLFGEGSYVGKGIYDVAAFERSLAGQVGENTLLSHDLFEGIYGRTALVTDVTLLEDYPAHYLTFTRRLRRWIRGDWQLLPWLSPHPPTGLANAPKRLSIIDRWKIFDNLRRSLATPALLLLLVLAWLWLPGSPAAWTVLLLGTPVLLILAQAMLALLNRGDRPVAQSLQPSRIELVRWALGIVFLPYEALLHLNAIATTLLRLFIVKRRMLQWTTAASTARSFKSNSLAATWGEMASSLVFAAALGAAVLLIRPEAGIVALPLVAVWMLSPLIAHRISQPILRTRTPLSEEQHQTLRGLARRTWAFFERYVGPDDHWLPPDHFQESPRGIVAHQTSPTNVGMLLLSTLTAFDLGYISLLGLAARLKSTFESMEVLEHYRGHLLNWYDTRTLEPLLPRYVSTVDSGNLAACLMVLRQGCDAMPDEPLVSAKQWYGLLDILSILTEMLANLAVDQPDLSIQALEEDLDEMRRRIVAVQSHPEQWVSSLAWLSTDGWAKISRRLMVFLEAPSSNLNADMLSGLRLYVDRLQHHMMSLQRAIDLLTPWLTALEAQPPRLFSQVDRPLSQAWAALREAVHGRIPRLGEAPQFCTTMRASLAQLVEQVEGAAAPIEQIEEARAWCLSLDESLLAAQLTAQELMVGYSEIAAQAEATIEAMDFTFLFDKQRQVFHIGYNTATEKLDANYYDLLASEARIASLIAVVKGDIPHSHWLHLGRPVTKVNGEQVLLSWSGTMFEYLMPALLMRSYDGTFLADSCYTAVEAHIAYGQEKGVPWGISESGYYGFDANMNYQYQAFGVPQLGFKRTLGEDLVVSPYASLLALSLHPQEVLSNLSDLDDLGMMGRYGLYEAIDYTEAHLPPHLPHAIVKSYMAHHQGMILVALNNYLLDNTIVQRFHGDARIQSIELLLQEKVPLDAPIQNPHHGEPVEVRTSPPAVRVTPWVAHVPSPVPQVHVLSQGQYGVLITNAGGGYSRWQDFALTRWQADTTLDRDGCWIYVQDRDSGRVWSATSQPTADPPEHQEVLFYPHKVEFRRSDGGISLDTQITIGTEGMEIRRVTLLNDSSQLRRLKVTSYGEVVLAPQAGDQRHPAFSKLFIESEYLPELNALLFRRRPRSAHDETPFMLHALVVERGSEVTGEYESDRARFVGRGKTLRAPAALQGSHALSGSVGSTLDPIMSLAQELDLNPHSRAQIAYITLAAPTREAALALAARYQSWQTISQAFVEARHHSEVELAELGIRPAALEHIQQLLSALLYPSQALRADPHILAGNSEGQSSLWRYGISGDYPILLVNSWSNDEPLIPEVLQAYAYWRKQNLKINLVILNQQVTGYASGLRNHLLQQLSAAGVAAALNQREGIFLLDADQMRDADRVLLATAARAVLDGRSGSLAAQVQRLSDAPTRLPDFIPTLRRDDTEPTTPLARPTNLLFDNGLGGFSPDGREYIIYLEAGQNTPHPWINVIANPEFGFLMSEAGSGPSWAVNSGENRLTPWHNDPVSDMPGEVLYLRDEETAQVWSVTPMPAGAAMPTVIRHGAGYSIFEQQSHGLNQKLTLFVAPDAPVKIARLRLENLSPRPRRITVTYYAEWVLGTTHDATQQYIVPEFEADLHALLASNPYNTEFGERVAFLAASKRPHGLTADREEFLGRLGSLANPAGLGRIGLASTVRAGSDPCAAIQLHIDLAADQSEEIFFLIGEGANRDDSLELIRQHQDPSAVEAAWQATHTFWDGVLGAISVTTPDPAMNLMLNRWLLYQTTVCRLWGRSALYQSSGAFGFRDQLQDVMALLHSQPTLAREHILKAAAHQFEAGDVLHWWHPPSGRGVRTRISDDLLWLPFVTAQYVKLTNDIAILHETIPFLTGDPLKPDEEERYGHYLSTTEGYSLYEHCRRSIQQGATIGAHGLPLMGAGDWNDGMNRVGIEGRGESVWLGWFLHATLMRFASLAEVMQDDPSPYRDQAARLAQAIEAHGWDGEWYRRATYDDGWPLGSHLNKECQIDAIAQSWAVISGAADPQRAEAALAAVSTRLVKDEDRLILLFDPPFDKTARDPGYIKGYPPGIRENGGQYTHAATWTAWAFAALGDGNRAEELFRLLNPIYQADSPEKAEQYRVEPYVLAADIYSVAPHTGRGGWTWYTGSSGWMYRLGVEAILGLNRAGGILRINPCIPAHWAGFEMTYRFGESLYHIVVTNPEGVNRGVKQVILDGVALPHGDIPLSESEQHHEVHILMGH